MNTYATVPATERDQQLLGMESIDDQMPVVFANGFSWVSLTCECGVCNKPLPSRHVRGLVVKQTKKMVSIEASGACYDCQVITRFVYRLYDDGRISGPTRRGWVTWGGVGRRSIFDKIKQKAGLILAKLVNSL